MPLSINQLQRVQLRALGWAVVGWCCFFWLSAASVSAQSALACPEFEPDSPKARNEIGVNILGWVHFSYDPVYPRPAYMRMSILNGISFKRRFAKSAIRGSMDVFRDSFEAGRGERAIPGYFSASGSAVRAEMRFGFEHHLTRSRIRPYAALDLVAQHERVRLDGEGRGDVAWGVDIQQYGYDRSIMRYGIALSTGLSWKLSKRFSCSVEGGAWIVLIDNDVLSNSARGTVYVDVLRSFALYYTWHN